MNNRKNRVFFVFATLSSVVPLQARTVPKLYETVTQSDESTQTQTAHVLSAPSRLSTMIALMKVEPQTRQKIMSFFTHHSKNAAFFVAELGFDVLKDALKDVLKDRVKTKIKTRLNWNT